MLRLFIDTNVIIATILPKEEDNIHCLAILLQNRIPLVTNRYVIKELRRVLPQYVSNSDAQQIIEFVQTKFEVIKTPSKNEFKKIKCSDRSDSPIICSAIKAKCVLVTEDFITRKDASEYVMSLSSKETVEVLGISLPRKGEKIR